MKNNNTSSILKISGIAILFFSPFVYHATNQQRLKNKYQKDTARTEQFINYSLSRLADESVKNAAMFDDYYLSQAHKIELQQDSTKYANEIKDIIHAKFHQTKRFEREFNRIFGADTLQHVKQYKHVCYELELSRRAKQK